MTVKYSIIIPTRNRAEILKRCLQCICGLESPDEDWEVLLLNNDSTDSTEEIVNSYRERLPNLRYFHTTDPGLHIGRNLGWEEAKGDVFCYIDDDSFVSKGWLKGIEKAFREPDVGLVGGPCTPQYEVEPPDWLNKMWSRVHPDGKMLGYLSILDLGDSIKEINPYHVFGCNFAIRKSVLLEASGFHPDAMPQELIKYRGDGESYVSQYVLGNGQKTLYQPKASVFHHVPKERMTLKYFYHRAYINGISDSFVRMREEHGLTIDNYRNKCGEMESRDNQTSYINMVKTYRLLKRGAYSIKNRAENYKKKFFPTEFDSIRDKMQKAYREGFAYHQYEVQKDPKLLGWVLRKDYLGVNGKLP